MQSILCVQLILNILPHFSLPFLDWAHVQWVCDWYTDLWSQVLWRGWLCLCSYQLWLEWDHPLHTSLVRNTACTSRTFPLVIWGSPAEGRSCVDSILVSILLYSHDRQGQAGVNVTIKSTSNVLGIKKPHLNQVTVLSMVCPHDWQLC